jgi:ABC-type phosphate/phosphonate transport system permease subunit
MAFRGQFCRILPASQVALAALFGGWGLWQRNQILSHDYLFGTGWNSTARFHVWPWPYKFAAISNLPALFSGLLLTIPISAVRPTLSEALQLAPTLVFVLLLWFWVGSRLDRRWSVADWTPWIAILLFMILSSVGAFLPLGYTGFLPYGFALWAVACLALSRHTHACSGIPHDSGLAP